MDFAEVTLAALRMYALVGVGVAALFLLIGVDRIDEDARGAYLFRPLLIPAIVSLWPLVVLRWVRLELKAS
ncbi:hypothetical protein QMT40_000194 [Parvibaculaceae bacterium PLY_AMNH_Bact1]|nr:hypothetical protein QMT40_000194 [Parvibaculaceae bacterium PLY_AMNH_Bact1]